MIINADKIEPAASSYACNYATALVKEAKERVKGTAMGLMIPPSVWESLQSEIAARVKQVFMEGAELACTTNLCPCSGTKAFQDALGIPKGV